MVKKRQQDFHKTKLKPGKILPRSRNVTKTGFKSKAIIIPTQSRKVKAKLTIQECIKHTSHAGPVASRANALNQLNNLIKKEENFSIYLSEIFNNIAKNVQDVEESIRDASVKILETVLQHTDSMKISFFLPLLTNILSCTMTHVDLKIKSISLRMLNILLKTHPHLLCRSFTILQNLQGLLSGQSYNTKSRKAGQKNKLLQSCGDSLYSQDWRIQVLEQMNMLLKAVLENLRGDTVKSDDTENEVYWDGESPLRIEIFAGGGLKPVDIYKAPSLQLKLNEFEDPKVVQSFVDNIMDVLSQIYIEEIADGTSKSDDDLVVKENIHNLNILCQVICHIGEWVQLISDKNSDSVMVKSFAKHLNDKIFRNVNDFPYIARTCYGIKSHGQIQHLPCVQLNLSLCYLYIAFALNRDSPADNYKNMYLKYVQSVLCDMAYNVKHNSIPMLLKIVKICLSLNQVHKDMCLIPQEFVHKTLKDMAGIIQVKDDSPNMQLLVSFFIELILQIGDECLINSCWFQKLLELLIEMSKSGKIDRKFLKHVRIIALRKYPLFLDSLHQMSLTGNTLKNLLTHANEHISETAVFLVYNMREISADFLYELSYLILTDSFCHPKKAFKLIQLLTHRFSDPSVPAPDRINFTTFLLNTALDTVNLDERWKNYDVPEFRSIWLRFEGMVPFSVLPCLRWKKHSKIFEVCYESLNRLPPYTVNRIAVKVIRVIMEENKNELPVHCVIAILRLNNPTMMERSCHMEAMQQLKNDALLFLSVISSLAIDDEWYECNVNPLMDWINRKILLDFLKHQEKDSQISKSGILTYYILRILNIFVGSGLVFDHDVADMITILENYKESCKETDISQQPLYNKLYSCFFYK